MFLSLFACTGHCVDEGSLSVQKITHHAEKRYLCTVCDKRYTSKNTLAFTEKDTPENGSVVASVESFFHLGMPYVAT